MKTTHTLVKVLTLCGFAALAGCQTNTPRQASATAGTAVDAAGKGPAPELKDITLRYNVPNARGTLVSVVPDFHFVSAKGNVILIRRELVSTTGSASRLHFNPAEPVDIAAEVQRKGAVISGAWQCGVAQYQITIRAYLIDADGNRSNSRDYTIHCNGG